MARISNWVVRRPIVLEFLWFAISVALNQGSRFAVSLAAASLLRPSDFTAWVLILTTIGYSPAMLLGIGNGMSRSIPLALGANRHQEANRVEQTALGVAWSASAALLLAGFAALAFGLPVAHASFMAVGLTLTVQVQQFNFRARLQFNVASAQQALLGAVLLVATCLLLSLHADDLEAFVYAYVTAAAAAGLLGVVMRGVPGFVVDLPTVRNLVGVGFPIMLVGLAFGILITSDRWIAATILETDAASTYALASLLASAVFLTTSIVSQQTYPRLAVAYGRDHHLKRAYEIARAQGRIAALLTLAAGLLVLLATTFIIPVLLPAYRDVTLPAGILIAGTIVYSLASGFGNYLNVVGGHWMYLGITALSVGVSVVAAGAGGLVAGAPGVAIGLAVALAAQAMSVALVARRSAGLA